MKKLTGVLFAAAFVFALQAGFAHVAIATGPFDDVVNYAPGYKYDSSKDPSYGVHSPSDSSSGNKSVNSNKTNSGKTVNSGSINSTIKALLDKISGLQSEVTKTKGEVKKLLKDGLKEGMTDADIKKIQELLASDQTLFPNGKVTGYFGPMTKDAIKKFQKKHGLSETGEIDEDTKDLFDEYLKTRTGSTTPKGFFYKEDVLKKVKGNFCTDSNSRKVFCMGYSHDDDDDNTPGNICERARFASQSAWAKTCDHSSSTKAFSDVKVKVTSGSTTVTFKMGSTTHTVKVKSIAQAVVLKAVADKLGKEVKDLNPRLVKEIKKKLSEAFKTSHSSVLKRAQSAIVRAELTINEVESEVEDADGDVDTDEAEELLDDANELLDDARVAFDGGEYKKARDLARDAEDKADDAQDALDDAN